MTKVTFEITPVVYVRIVGEIDPPQPGDQLPRCRKDNGLVGRFMTWMSTEDDLYPVRNTGGTSGGGFYAGYFSEGDARRIEDWLMKQPEIQEGMK